jgi:hypothetical protein
VLAQIAALFEKIRHFFLVVVVQTVHRDALAVALQFAAHVETDGN